MTLQFARESIRAVWDEAEPLLHAHWLEIAHFDDIILAPQQDRYFQMADADALRVFTARDPEFGNALVGYVCYISVPHLHYANSKQASQDVLFLLPSYRSAGNGAGLINFADDYLRAEGVQCVYQHVKLAHNFGPLLKHLGYVPVETIHVKRLDL